MGVRRFQDLSNAAALDGTEIVPITQDGVDVKTTTQDIANLGGGGGGGSGTVTSVALSVPTGLSVAGSPITTSGTFTVTYTAGYQGYTSAEATKLSGIASGATANTGTVTSVNLGSSTGLTPSGGPITGSGSLTYTLSANLLAWHALATSAKEDAFAKGDLIEGTGVTLTGTLTDRLVGSGDITISASGGGGGSGTVTEVATGTGLTGGPITDDGTISLNSASIASLALADSAVQPTDLDDYAPLASPVFTGNPEAPTPATGDNDTSIATTAFVKAQGYTTNVGTVTSVGLSMPTGLSVAGSPITTSGSFTVTYTAGYVGYTTAEQTKLSGIATGATANTGTVTSVAASVPTGFSVSGSPVTTTGTLAITYAAGYQGYTSVEATKLSGIATGATANTGTVTSVGMTVPTGLSISGSPVTTSGTLALTYTAGYVGYTTTEASKLAALPADAQSRTPNIQTIASASTITPTFSNDMVVVTALAANATIAAATGTAIHGLGIVLRIKDNGTSRTLTWNGVYRGIGGALPAATTLGKTMYIPMIYNTTESVWDVFPASIQP